MPEEMQGQMEKHHIIFRSHGGCDYSLNIVHLPAAFHKGTNGPHHNRETDLTLKRKLQERLQESFPERFYDLKEIIKILEPWNKKSREKIEKQIKKQNKCMAKGYRREDIIRTLMGGKLYD
jgi:hypothetical protein